MQWLPRYAISMAGGLLAALLLVAGMQWLIARETPELDAGRDGPVIEFVRLKRDSDLRVRARERPQDPPRHEPRPPPTPRLEVEAVRPRAIAPDIVMPDLDLHPSFDGPFIGSAMQGSADRDFVAVSRTAPQYPYRAEHKRIEGWVRVSFLITESGEVQDVVLIDAEPEGVFDQAAMRAVYKWRFRPRIAGGRPVAARAEQTITFRLDGR